MSDLTAHHYPMSAFARKIRMLLGYQQLVWQSVDRAAHCTIRRRADAPAGALQVHFPRIGCALKAAPNA